MKKLIFLMIFLLLLGGVVTYRMFFSGNEDTWICQNNQWVRHGNPSAPQPITPCGESTPPLIGGQKDDHGCLTAAGYSWCDAKQICLRIWEEGCGTVITPASRSSVPTDRSTCERNGGRWGTFGISNRETCNPATSDAGKTCTKQSDCEGACITDKEIAASGDQNTIRGTCTSWLYIYGCAYVVNDGKAQHICFD